MANSHSQPLNISANTIMDHIVTCQHSRIINSYGFWHHNPFEFTTPVLLLQMVVIFLTTKTIHILLKPFHQTTVMAQIIGGTIIGPSFLGEKPYFNLLFPMRSRYILRTWAEFGMILHLFVLGVQIDLRLIKHIRRKAFIIGLSGCLFPLVFGMTSFHIIQQNNGLDNVSANGIPTSVAVNSMSSLLVITNVLKELNMLSSELGRLASSTAMVSDLVGFATSMIVMSVSDVQYYSSLKPLYLFPVVITYLGIVLFLLRPLTIWIVHQTSAGESMKQSHFVSIICIVMGLSFVGSCVGTDASMCAFFFGLILPDGPPLGSQLVHKLDLLTSEFLIPIFCAISGIKMELYLLKESSTMKMGFIIMMAYVGKFLGVILPSLFFGLSFLKALCLALIMCCRGIVEIGIYCLSKDKKVINAQIFALLITNMVVVTMIASSIVGYLYDPSRRYKLDARRAIYKSKQNNLRMLVCKHEHENENPIISLLEFSNPTAKSPITAFVLQLIELRGSVTAFLKPHHQPTNTIVASSMSLINALNQFQRFHSGNVVVQHFTTVAPYASMHDDICTLALDKRVAIIIVPFHKQWGITGMVEASKLSVRNLNRNVLGKAPCSVGILVHRGQMISNQSMLTRKTLYHVVMLFIGGADDREALAYTKRMVENQNISLTLVWLRPCDVNVSNREVDDLDKHIMGEILRDSMMGKKMQYKELFVKDGIGTTQVIQSLVENTPIDLFIVGKNHGQHSVVTLGLTDWIEYPELGIIGDILVNSSDMLSVLVVQQQQEEIEPQRI